MQARLFRLRHTPRKIEHVHFLVAFSFFWTILHCKKESSVAAEPGLNLRTRINARFFLPATFGR